MERTGQIHIYRVAVHLVFQYNLKDANYEKE